MCANLNTVSLFSIEPSDLVHIHVVYYVLKGSTPKDGSKNDTLAHGKLSGAVPNPLIAGTSPSRSCYCVVRLCVFICLFACCVLGFICSF